MSNKHAACISFLTGLPFNPNNGNIKKSIREEECLMTRKLTKKYMVQNNKLYFDNKTWLKLQGKSGLKQSIVSDRNSNRKVINSLIKTRVSLERSNSAKSDINRKSLTTNKIKPLYINNRSNSKLGVKPMKYKNKRELYESYYKEKNKTTPSLHNSYAKIPH